MIGMGGYQFYAACTAAFRQKFRLGEMRRLARRLVLLRGRLGHAVRGMRFTSSASPLLALAGEPFGPWASGLFAYGGDGLTEARYHRSTTP